MLSDGLWLCIWFQYRRHHQLGVSPSYMFNYWKLLLGDVTNTVNGSFTCVIVDHFAVKPSISSFLCRVPFVIQYCINQWHNMPLLSIIVYAWHKSYLMNLPDLNVNYCATVDISDSYFITIKPRHLYIQGDWQRN